MMIETIVRHGCCCIIVSHIFTVTHWAEFLSPTAYHRYYLLSRRCVLYNINFGSQFWMTVIFFQFD